MQEYFSVSQAADRLGVSKETIRVYIGKGAIKASRLPGGYYRIAATDLIEMMEPKAAR